MCWNSETNPQGFNVLSLDSQLVRLMYTPLLTTLTEKLYTLDTPRIIKALKLDCMDTLIFFSIMKKHNSKLIF